MGTREPSVELFYDPADLDPAAPRLHVRKNGSAWELRDDGGLLSAHATQSEAVNAALACSKRRFSEILVRGSTGRAEWVMKQDPRWLALANGWRKAPEGRRRMGVGSFPGHHVVLPTRRRPKKAGDPAGACSPPVERIYDFSDLDPGAPTLHIGRNGGGWEVRDGDGQLLTRHDRLPAAMDAALARSEACFSEILIRTASGLEWSLRHNPDWTELARALNRPIAAEREAAD